MTSRNWKYTALRHLPNVCVTCGETDKKLLTADHIVPRSAGGALGVNNLRVLCYTCHREATNAYRRSRLTQVNKDGKITQHDTWWKRSPKQKKLKSRAKHANRATGW